MVSVPSPLENGKCELVSRKNIDKSFTALASMMAKLPVKNAILDGELVCLDDDGRSRGDSVCSNRVRVRRDVLERELLQGLQSKVLRDEVIDYVLDQFEKQLVRELEGISGEMDRMKKRKAELQSEIVRLTAGLATGFHSPTVMSEITKREHEISDISDRLLSSKSESVRSRIAVLKQNVVKRMHGLRQCLNSDPIAARAYVTKHVEKIEMDPDGGIYVASGSWNLLGSDTLGAERTLGMCRGAELNCLRRPFQGRALPVSYPGTGGIQKL
jgi:hypothetical protein